MILTEINVYPIKSLGGIRLDNSKVEERGLQFDRRWMLVDEKNQFLSQREFPKMAAVGVKLNADSLTVSNNSENLQIPFEAESNQTASAKIWSSRVKSKVYENEINDWFSEVLRTKCRLVLMPEESKRRVSPFYAVRKFEDTVSFADGYPFLLIGENSLNDLNSKLEMPLPMNRFRPNLVISGSKPFAEDNWKKIKIGETIFHVVKPCARCVMTTINQISGEKDGKEPLKTLAKYRTKRGKVLFGQNLIAENAGAVLKIGDKIELIDAK